MMHGRLLVRMILGGALVVATAASATGCGGPKARGAGGGEGDGRATGAGAGAAAGDDDTAATPPTAASEPRFRLPRDVRALRYRARLGIDPAVATFAGWIEIDLRVDAATDVIWLNAEHLTVAHATLRPSASGATAGAALEVIPVAHDFVGFRVPPATRLSAGDEVTLAIEYAGKIDDNDTMGIFRQKEGNDWYVYTQFETLAARWAFPCIDEPDSKVPWTLELEVPDGLTALGNAPVKASAPANGTAGHTLVSFETTKPLPTYLVAFAVGPFDTVDAGTSAHGTPLRIVTMRGRAADAWWAAETTKPLLAQLEDFFAQPYPYEKLDALVVPLTVGFGAMEHPGLITYSEGVILMPPKGAAFESRWTWAYYGAHEMAHQWFGNLVTPAFWDDIWLNEAFATWMEPKIIAGFRPAWRAEEYAAGAAADVIRADSLASARRIHQPVASNDDALSAFDGISYAKGAAVITMFERWVGAETFRKGVQTYLAAHAWGNATSEDFLAAIGEAAGRDVATPFSTFLDQVGAPEITMSTSCVAGATPAVTLTQRRALPPGSAAEENQTWQVPVCVRWGAGKATGSQCTLLTAAQGELTLDGASRCPDWIVGNADGAGYYRTVLEPEALTALLDHWRALTSAEKMTLASDVNAMLIAGKVDLDTAIGLVGRLASETSPLLVERGVKLMTSLGELVPTSGRDAYAREVRAIFGARARELGWGASGKGRDDDEVLRRAVVPLVAIDGADAKLGKEAVKLARAWLRAREHDRANPKGDKAGDSSETIIARSVLGVVLSAAVQIDRGAVFELEMAAAVVEPDRALRQTLLSALGDVHDPALGERALGLLQSDAVDIREALTILGRSFESRWLRQTSWTFIRDHVDGLLAKLPVESAAFLAIAAGGVCDPAVRDEVAAFLAKHIADKPAGPRAVAQNLERLDLCIAREAALRPRVEARYPAAK